VQNEVTDSAIYGADANWRNPVIVRSASAAHNMHNATRCSKIPEKDKKKEKGRKE
jgi:hypothetical protein